MSYVKSPKPVCDINAIHCSMIYLLYQDLAKFLNELKVTKNKESILALDAFLMTPISRLVRVKLLVEVI